MEDEDEKRKREREEKRRQRELEIKRLEEEEEKERREKEERRKKRELERKRLEEEEEKERKEREELRKKQELEKKKLKEEDKQEETQRKKKEQEERERIQKEEEEKEKKQREEETQRKKKEQIQKEEEEKEKKQREEEIQRKKKEQEEKERIQKEEEKEKKQKEEEEKEKKQREEETQRKKKEQEEKERIQKEEEEKERIQKEEEEKERKQKEESRRKRKEQEEKEKDSSVQSSNNILEEKEKLLKKQKELQLTLDKLLKNVDFLKEELKEKDLQIEKLERSVNSKSKEIKECEITLENAANIGKQKDEKLKNLSNDLKEAQEKMKNLEKLIELKSKQRSEPVRINSPTSVTPSIPLNNANKSGDKPTPLYNRAKSTPVRRQTCEPQKNLNITEEGTATNDIPSNNSPVIKSSLHVDPVLEALKKKSLSPAISTSDGTGRVKPSSSSPDDDPFADTEKELLLDLVNKTLVGDKHVAKVLPVAKTSIVSAFKDGILFCKLICKLYPNQLDERAITLDVGDKRDKQDNMNLALLTGKGIGLCLNSVKIEDLMEDQEEAFLRLIWQIFKGYYLNNVKKNKAQLELIKEGDEEKPGLLLPETIITRWVNVHLEKAGVSKRLKNFPQDLKDSEIYLHLLHHLYKADKSALSENDLKKRAENVVQSANKVGCISLICSEGILQSNARQNFALISNLIARQK